MFKVAICDDEEGMVESIEKMIDAYAVEKYCSIDVEILSSGVELYNCLNEGIRFDLIFLDIEMEEMSGIEVATYIRQVEKDYMTKIVFVTGKDGYERQLFDVQPFNFIPKPVDKTRIDAVLTLALKLEHLNTEVFHYKKGKESHKVPIKDIRYFESKAREINIYTVDVKDTFYGISAERL